MNLLRWALSGLLWVGLGATARTTAAGFDHHHVLLDQALKAHVRSGLVDYTALKSDRTGLDQYLAGLTAVEQAEFVRWPKDSRLAFLINAYNAFTLRLILDHYPVKSIKGIGGWVKGPWDQPVVRLFGRTLTLNELEHDVLRVEYAEPRIHFALVCAARGCPPLRHEAYVAERLEAQLDDQARRFLATPDKNRVDAENGVVYLSPIFKWYGADYEKASGSVLAALQPYWPAAASAALRRGGFKIRYAEYDWSLNQAPRP